MLRPPKREWEGAALRNSETRTNNLLPVAGLESGAEAYARAVESWWENLAAAGRPEPPSARLRLALGDVAMLLEQIRRRREFQRGLPRRRTRIKRLARSPRFSDSPRTSYTRRVKKKISAVEKAERTTLCSMARGARRRRGRP